METLTRLKWGTKHNSEYLVPPSAPPKLPLTNIRKIVIQFFRYLSTPSGYQATSGIRRTLYERMIEGSFLEKWDIYNNKGNKTGRIHHRGDPLNHGDYHMVVENWIKNNEGQFLIQKRTKPLRNFVNPWSTTAGSAIQGETSIEAIQRETQEEMGLYFHTSEIKLIERSFFDDFFMDIYETLWNGKDNTILFDPNEVHAVKWATKFQIQEMYKAQEFYSHKTTYLQNILDHSII